MAGKVSSQSIKLLNACILYNKLLAIFIVKRVVLEVKNVPDVPGSGIAEWPNGRNPIEPDDRNDRSDLREV